MNVKSKNIWTAENEAKLQELLRQRAAVYDESAEELRGLLEEIIKDNVHDEMLDTFIAHASELQEALQPFSGSLSGGQVNRR